MQIGVLNEEEIIEEDGLFWGHRHHHLTLAAAGISALKWLKRVTNAGETGTVPHIHSAVYSAAPRSIILLIRFVMAASVLSTNPCVYPFGGLGGEGVVVVFAFKMVPLLTELARLTVQVWSPGTMTASQENGTSGMLAVSVSVCVCVCKQEG